MRIIPRCEICGRRVWRGRLDIHGTKEQWWHHYCWWRHQENNLYRHELAVRDRLLAIEREQHEGPSPWTGI